MKVKQNQINTEQFAQAFKVARAIADNKIAARLAEAKISVLREAAERCRSRGAEDMARVWDLQAERLQIKATRATIQANAGSLILAGMA